MNYYIHNQWVDGDLPISINHPRYRPFRDLLGDIYDRYQRPLFVAETGIEGDSRSAWLRITGHEVTAARRAGIPVEGICLYPIFDYPGWEDERHCPTGLFGYMDDSGNRPLCRALAEELKRQQAHRTGIPGQCRPSPGHVEADDPATELGQHFQSEQRGTSQHTI